MDPAVHRSIADAILDHGPISFAEFMEAALYGSGGFYERPPIGPDGAFVTSPHVHPVFAQLLASALRELWELVGRPDPWQVAEVGAGDGTLAAQLVEHLSDLPLTYVAVERSPGAREAIADLTGVQGSGTLPREAHMVLANELLDNLAFRRVRLGPGGPAEVGVGLEDGRLVEVLLPPDDAVRAAAHGLEPGDETVIPAGALTFIDALATTLTDGYALLIDYGSEGAPGGVTHGYRDQRMVDDPLDRPGTADITTGVDFDAIAERARSQGLQAFPSVTQRDALAALGYEAWARGELERQHEMLDARDGVQAVRAWSARSRATLLVDPDAMGRFRWLLLASPGLPVPPWLGTALGRGTPAGPVP